MGLSTGNLSGSRWGIKGKEELGNGLAAIFQLEDGFDITNGTSGQGGRLFGRQAYVGLSDTRFGTVTLGRQYDSVVDYLQPLTAPVPQLSPRAATATRAPSLPNARAVASPMPEVPPTTSTVRPSKLRCIIAVLLGALAPRAPRPRRGTNGARLDLESAAFRGNRAA